jgi:DNA-binding NtrC family response regulator
LQVGSDFRKRGFGKTVLVVDDKQPIRKLLATAFLSDGFKTAARRKTEHTPLNLPKRSDPM